MMTDVLIYWRDYRKNMAEGNALRWHSNARLLGELLPGDRLWMVTSGKCLRQEAEQAGFLVAVWQVKEVVANPDDDPAYPADDYRYRVIADESNSQSFGDTAVLVDHILRPAGRDRAVSIGRFLQGPRRLSDEKVRLLRAAAGPQMAQQWLTGKGEKSRRPAMQGLRSLLATMPPGRIGDTRDLESALAECWDEFVEEGQPQSSGMTADKLCGRVEHVEWNPPFLTFEIERHGGAVMGSSRAEKQSWRLNVERETRSWSPAGHRQLRPMEPRLNVRPLAEEVADLIESRQRDKRLKWYSDDRVQVIIGEILPAHSAVQQTLAGQRTRFWKALDDRLGGEWERSGQTYTLRTSEGER